MSKGYVESVETTVKDEFGNDRVTTVRKVFKHKSDNENFYFVFINYVQWMYNIKGVIPIKVLHALMEETYVNTGKVSISMGKRAEIIERLGISRAGFYNAINQLVDVKVLSRVYYTNRNGEKVESQGDFLINPEMLWKGDKEKRKELKVTFEAVYSNQ